MAAVALVLAAVEKPTKPSEDYRSVMRSNASLVDLSAGNGNALGRDTNIENRVQAAPGARTLRELYHDKDYAELVIQSDLLRANYEKILAFWTEKKGEDGMAIAQRGLKAATDMHEAALARNDKGISVAQSAIEKSCRDCHTGHRVIVLTDSSFQIRISSFEAGN
jgi:hypothetical protein